MLLCHSSLKGLWEKPRKGQATCCRVRSTCWLKALARGPLRGYAVEELLEPPNFARYRSYAAALNNRAVFEIPGMLQEILKKAAP